MGSFAAGELIALVVLWVALVRYVHPWLLVPMACISLISLQPIVVVLLDIPAPEPVRRLIAALVLTAFGAFAVTRGSRVALTLLAVWAGLTAFAALGQLRRAQTAQLSQLWLALVWIELVLKAVIVGSVAHVTRKRPDLLARGGRGEAAPAP